MESATANPVIPTSYRKKIGHTHGYPLGAEVISAALADVPQFSRFTIAFHEDYSRRRIAWPDPANYRVLGVSYRKIFDLPPTDKPALDLDWRERNWEIYVYPVPRTRKYLIKTLLLSEALPTVRTWLLRNAANPMGRQNIVFSFSENSEKLSLDINSKLEPEIAKQ